MLSFSKLPWPSPHNVVLESSLVWVNPSIDLRKGAYQLFGTAHADQLPTLPKGMHHDRTDQKY